MELNELISLLNRLDYNPSFFKKKRNIKSFPGKYQVLQKGMYDKIIKITTVFHFEYIVYFLIIFFVIMLINLA